MPSGCAGIWYAFTKSMTEKMLFAWKDNQKMVNVLTRIPVRNGAGIQTTVVSSQLPSNSPLGARCRGEAHSLSDVHAVPLLTM